MDELLSSMEALIAPQVAARQLRYTYEHYVAHLTARADPEKVKQIVVNLLTNAIKFTPPGGEIRVTCVVDDSNVLVAVKDTGPGIVPGKLEVIFEAFVQADRKLSRPGEGVGLGLAISREMARAMDGDVSVESVVERGSTFTLVLPRAG